MTLKSITTILSVGVNKQYGVRQKSDNDEWSDMTKFKWCQLDSVKVLRLYSLEG